VAKKSDYLCFGVFKSFMSFFFLLLLLHFEKVGMRHTRMSLAEKISS